MRKLIFSGILLLASASIALGQSVEEKANALILELQNEPAVMVIVEDDVEVGQQTAPTGAEPNYSVKPKAQPGTPEYEAKLEKAREKRRRDIQFKIGALGPTAVPYVGAALGDQSLKFRTYLAESLVMIGDSKAAPYLIDYLAEGLTKIRNADSLALKGETALADRERKEGAEVVASASECLFNLTGKQYGTDVVAWQSWWETVKNVYQ